MRLSRERDELVVSLSQGWMWTEQGCAYSLVHCSEQSLAAHTRAHACAYCAVHL